MLTSPNDLDGLAEFGFIDGQMALDDGGTLTLTGSAVSGVLLTEARFRIGITTGDGSTTREIKVVPLSGSGGTDTIHAGFGSDHLDGQGGSDTYILKLLGGDSESLIEAFDSGQSAFGTDVMKVTGTAFEDQFLLRASADPNGLAFVGMINSDTRRDSEGNLVEDLYVERTNYENVERLVVNGILGDDHFAVDDVRAETTLNGGLGEDFFQIGQLYRSQRTPELANVDPGDVFATIETTRGWLSNGISQPMTVNGGPENDDFVVFHNLAVLTLNGEDGDDTFLIKAFALAGSQEPKRGRTDVSGGHGADLVQYAVNAPVNIDGGDGFDTVIIIGTEFGDDFVITKDGVYGAGLNVNYVNIESLEIDGAEGNDRFFVRSTGEKFITHISGGLGSDSLFMSGDTPPVISNDLLGHSGIITHSIENEGDPTEYDDIKIEGISANVADDDEPAVRITESEGITFVTEGLGEDNYTIVLASKPEDDVFIKALAPLQTPTEEELKARQFSVYSDHPQARNETDGSGTTLRFTPDNWNFAQTVYVDAKGDYDDLAYEGDRYGVINHTVLSEETSFSGAIDSYTLDEILDTETGIINVETAVTDNLANFPTAGEGLRGAYIEFIEGDGAGQRFLIKENEATSVTFFGTFSINNLPKTDGSSSYVIRRYDGLALPSVNVQIYDNDAAGVAVTQVDDLGVPDGETQVAEGGFSDYLQVFVTRDPVDPIGTPVEVTLSSKVQQVEFTGSPDGTLNLDGSLTLSFTSKNTPQTVRVSAASDAIKEGFHYGLIEITVSGEGDGTGSVTGETFELTDKPEEYIGPAVDFLGRPEAFIGLAYVPKPETVSVTLDGTPITYIDYEDIQDKTAVDFEGLGYTVVSNKVIFIEGDQLPSFAAKITKGTLVVDYAYTIPGYDGLFVDPVSVKVADNDAPGVLIRQTYGSTDVIEASLADKILLTGTVTSAGTDTLVDDTGPFPTDGSLIDKIVKITGGAGEGQQAVIHANTATTLTLFSSFSGLDTSSIYEIVDNGDLLHVGKVTLSGAFSLTDDTGPFAPEDSLAGYLLFAGTQVRTIVSNTDTELTLDADWDPALSAGDSYVIIAQGEPWTDTYSVQLTSDPGSQIWVVVKPEITKTTRGKIRTDDFQVIVSVDADPADYDTAVDPIDGGQLLKLRFDSSNWDDPYIVKVVAKDDTLVDGGDTKVFAPRLHVLNDIRGPVYVEGKGGGGSLVTFEAVMLPGETNVKPDTKQLVQAEGTTAEVVTLDALSSGDVGTISELIGKTLEIAEGEVIDKFRLIVDAVQSTEDLDNTILTLNAPFTVLQNGVETEVDIADGTKYLITEESLNFFVNEEEQIDFMFLFHEDSVADSTGYRSDSTTVGYEGNGLVEEFATKMNGKRIYGFGMGPDLMIGGLKHPGGITYADLEVVELNLGSGNEEIIVTDTERREDGFQTWTILNTGDGNDVVYVSLTEERYELITGTVTSSTEVTLTDDGNPFGSDNSLVGYIVEITTGTGAGARRQIIANTSDTITVSSAWPTESGFLGTDSQYRIIGEADGPFALNTEAGNDKVYAGGGTFTLNDGSERTFEASTIPLVIFGGEGDDLIEGGIADDIIFGDRGRVDFFNEEGMIVTRLGADREVITGEVTWAENLILADEFTDGQANLTGSLINIDGLLVNFPIPDYPIEEGLKGLMVQITHYIGFGQELLITDNTENTLTLSGNWDPVPLPEEGNPNSKFRIPLLPEDQTDGVVRDPSLLISTHANIVGNDTITGNAGSDRIFGGAGNDTINGKTGDDIVFGDNGRLDYTPHSPETEDGPAVGEVVPASLGMIQTIHYNIGGPDIISGNAGADLILGGVSGDTIYGDNESSTAGSDDDGDIIIGDNGEVVYSGGIIARFRTTDTTDSTGGGDTIFGNYGEDLILGGVNGSSDEIHGNEDADIIVGDDGEFRYDIDADLSTLDVVGTVRTDVGGKDIIYGDGQDDIILGATGGDEIHGGSEDDLVLGDFGKVRFLNNVALLIETKDFDTDDVGDTDGIVSGIDIIYGDEHEDILVGGDKGDIIDGGNENDLIFGDNVRLENNPGSGAAINPRFRALSGTEIYDGDGNPQIDGQHQPNPDGTPAWADWVIKIDETAGFNAFGDDYIAGGAHDDTIFGQRGDDVIQGDGSIDGKLAQNPVDAYRDPDGTLKVVPSFEAVTDGNDYIEGNDGADVIFGNLGQDDILGGSSELFSLTTPDLRPDGSDLIFGGAGNRIDRNHVLTDNNRDTIVADEEHALDADMILGDNGNIFHLVGTNGTNSGDFLTFNYDNYSVTLRIIPRAAQLLDYTPGGLNFDPAAADDIGGADEIHGESGDDFIYGMKGDDVLFGDAQDDDTIGGYGHDWISGGSGEDGILGDDGRIFTSRNGYSEPLNGLDEPKEQTAISIPGPFTGAVVFIADRLTKTVDLTPFEFGGSDIMYGGLGDDFLHGGADNDAMSGAEALTDFYDAPQPYSDYLGYDPATRKLAAYDADNPRAKIDGFLLNFEALDAIGGVIEDGKDRLFGDLGHDWIVGGTGHDRLFGGFGDDLLNLDDNLNTNGGSNEVADDRSWGDFAYGGGGLDVLIANTGLDRMFDWTGEFNSFIVPFKRFGAPTVNRLPSPHVKQFLLDLGAASGADPTLTEPNGELGLVTQKDPEWREQHGAPRDPQPGNGTGRFDDAGGPEDDTDKTPTAHGSTPGSSPDSSGGGKGKGKNLMAAEAPLEELSDGSALTYDEIDPIIDAAINRWIESTLFDEAMLTRLDGLTFLIADLEGDALALTVDDTVIIDVDGAGHGWFIDDTPYQDTEFMPQNSDEVLTANEPSDAYGDMDLLTVVMHELGHVFGYDDIYAEDNETEIMSATLDEGVRYLPEETFADQVQNNSENLISLDLTPDESGAEDTLDTLVNDNPWLVKYLLDGAEEDTDPNGDIAITVLPDDEESDSSGSDTQSDSDPVVDNPGKEKKK